MSSTNETRKPKIGEIVFYYHASPPQGSATIRPAIVVQLGTTDDPRIHLNVFSSATAPEIVKFVSYSQEPQEGCYSFEAP